MSIINLVSSFLPRQMDFRRVRYYNEIACVHVRSKDNLMLSAQYRSRASSNIAECLAICIYLDPIMNDRVLLGIVVFIRVCEIRIKKEMCQGIIEKILEIIVFVQNDL